MSKTRTYFSSLFKKDNVDINGPFEIIDISGKKALHPKSMKTKVTITSSLHQREQGSCAVWVSPMEDLSFFPASLDMKDVDVNAFNYPIISDAEPARDVVAMKFGLYWSHGYPQLLAKFASGGVWSTLDYGISSFVYAEKLELRRSCWYYIAFTWDKDARKIDIYINGIRVGFNEMAQGFQKAGNTLFIGNPMMAMRDLKLLDVGLSANEINEEYEQNQPANNELADQDIRDSYFINDLPAFDVKRGAEWREAYSCSFRESDELVKWHLQIGRKYREQFRIETTREGLYIKTPDSIDPETRMYLWSPKAFTGDQWIEYEFCLESPKGLAVLVMYASGLQRQDFIDDDEMPESGSMQFILRDIRNYHWEYMRRVDVIRTDVETQYMAKNPMDIRMFYNCIPKFEQQRWYRLRFVKIDNRLHGSIDGRTVFDVNDSAFNSTGPVYDFGRIGLRQMFNTTMRYRNFSVHVRN